MARGLDSLSLQKPIKSLLLLHQNGKKYRVNPHYPRNFANYFFIVKIDFLNVKQIFGKDRPMSTDKTPTSSSTISALTTIPWSILEVGQLLGSGSYGDVYLAKWNGIEVAVKQLHLKTLAGDLAADFQREAMIMSQCQFSNVVKLHGICQEPGHIAMVMEYLPKGSLYQVLHDSKETLPWEPVRWDIAIRVGEGLSYLHSQNILHRDLKSLNILLDSQYCPKIADFGLAKIKLENNSTTTKAKQGMGTTRWRAPELFKRGTSPNTASDVYSYGMVLWEIASRQLPFSDAADDATVISWIKDGEQENLPADCPKNYGEWVQDCWKKEANERPSVEKVVAGLLQAKPKQEVKLELVKSVEKAEKDDRVTPKIDQSSSEEGISEQPSSVASCQIDFAWLSTDVEESLLAEPIISNAPIVVQSQPRSTQFIPPQSTVVVCLDEVDYETGNALFRKSQYEQSLPYFEKASQQGYPAADLRLLQLYAGGLDVLEDPQKTQAYKQKVIANIDWFQARARENQAGAQVNLAICYENGWGVPKDLFEGVKYYQLAANQGDMAAQSALGRCYKKGFGVTRDLMEAAKYYQLAAAQGDIVAQSNLGQFYQHGLGGLRKDLTKAVEYYRLAARRCVRARNNLANCYYKGEGVKKNFEEAVKHYQLAAKRKSAKARNSLGQCYQRGEGVSKDLKQALRYYLSAADQGYAPAQNNVGDCYRRGEGVTKDVVKALQYYQLAADQDNRRAQNSLGKCYERGRGVASDLDKAVKYYRLAANQGYEAARINLENLFKQHPYLKFREPTVPHPPFFSLSNSSGLSSSSASTSSPLPPSSPPPPYSALPPPGQ